MIVATPAGAYLWAVATNSPAGTPPGDAARQVFDHAFRLAVRLRLRPDTPLPTIAAVVANAAYRQAAPILPVREAEMLVRQALGETVPTADIEPVQVVAVHVLMFVALVDELALTDDELVELIAEAERVVSAQSEAATASSP